MIYATRSLVDSGPVLIGAVASLSQSGSGVMWVSA